MWSPLFPDPTFHVVYMNLGKGEVLVIVMLPLFQKNHEVT